MTDNETGTPKLLIKGLDSLYVSCDVDTSTSRLDWEELAYLREKIQQERSEKFSVLRLGSETFALRPFGKHPYKFILSNRHFEIRLAERMHPACFVQFSSEGLWTQGVSRLWERLCRWFKSMDIRFIRKEVISRADWAFDFDLRALDFKPDHFVSRAHKDAAWRELGNLQSLQFGHGEVVIRIYDKVAEVRQQSGKEWLFELWGQSENVHRIEFQVRGPRLREAGIQSLADLKTLGGDILRELATAHTSLRRPTGDSNRSRWPLHPLWSALLDAIASLPQEGLVRDYRPLNALEYRRHKLGKSLHGLLKAVAFHVFQESDHKRIPDLEWVLEELASFVEPHHSPIIWESDLRKKISESELGL